MLNLRRRFGLDVDAIEHMLESQEGKCAICRETFDDDRKSRRAHLDHCHKSDEPRGFLCGTCNVGIGMFHESPAKLRRAIEYLQKAGT